MAHYAFLDDNNFVTHVIVGKNENEPDNDGNIVDWEKHYEEFVGQKCLRTSYNTYAGEHKFGGVPFRKNYASPGFYYDKEWDAFRPPQPYESWILNYDTFLWEPPIPMPTEETEGFFWRWGEINKQWIKVKTS